MDLFAKRLRERARELELSDPEVNLSGVAFHRAIRPAIFHKEFGKAILWERTLSGGRAVFPE